MKLKLPLIYLLQAPVLSENRFCSFEFLIFSILMNQLSSAKIDHVYFSPPIFQF